MPLGITDYLGCCKLKLSLAAVEIGSTLSLPLSPYQCLWCWSDTEIYFYFFLSFFSSINTCVSSSFCFTWPVFSSPSPLPLLSGRMSGSQHLPDCQQRWPRRHSVGYLFRGVRLRMLLTHQIMWVVWLQTTLVGEVNN